MTSIHKAGVSAYLAIAVRSGVTVIDHDGHRIDPCEVEDVEWGLLLTAARIPVEYFIQSGTCTVVMDGGRYYGVPLVQLEPFDAFRTDWRSE